MTDEKKIYKHETRSLYDLSVCLALGARLVAVDRSNPKSHKFFLESEDVDLNQASLDLASKKLIINAYELLDAYSRAKTIIHSS